MPTPNRSMDSLTGNDAAGSEPVPPRDNHELAMKPNLLLEGVTLAYLYRHH